MKLFPAFFDCPTDMRFKEQEADEKIELLLKPHGITNLPWIIGGFIGYLIPLIIVKLGLFNLAPSIPSNIFQTLVLFWYLALFGFIFVSFLGWYFNIYIITNLHIIDMAFTSILATSVTEFEITDVESTKYTYKGLLGSLFHFGDVEIETASKDQTITFGKIPYPEKVTDRIEDLEQTLKGQGEKEHA